MFDDHPLSTQLLPIQLVHGIIGIAVVLEFNKAIPEKETGLFIRGERRQLSKSSKGAEPGSLAGPTSNTQQSQSRHIVHAS